MAMSCTRCGATGPEGTRFCHICGAPVGQPSPVGEPRADGLPGFLPPSAGPVTAAAPPAAPSPGWSRPGPPVPPPPVPGVPMAAVTTRRRLPIALKVLIPVVATAIVAGVAALALTGHLLPGGQPRTPPALWCDESKPVDGYPGSYYTFGDDEIPVLDIYWPEKTQVTCLRQLHDGTGSAVQLRYDSSRDPYYVILGYANALRRSSGFMLADVSGVMGTSGYLWRGSVDSAKVLMVAFDCDDKGCNLAVGKLDLASAPPEVLPYVTSQAPSEIGLTLSPATGWKMYETYQTDHVGTGDITSSYAKVDGDRLLGTMQVVRHRIGGRPNEASLDAYADFVTTDFHPRDPHLKMDTRTETTIDGRRAIVCGLRWGNLQFQFVVVQLSGAYLTVTSAVDAGASPDLINDVSSMIDSLSIAG